MLPGYSPLEERIFVYILPFVTDRKSKCVTTGFQYILPFVIIFFFFNIYLKSFLSDTKCNEVQVLYLQGKEDSEDLIQDSVRILEVQCYVT